ncbi:MAG: vitamin B12 dependent-methionine synthase activation domain-containing protein [Rikenellaceae bacterium]
MNEVKVDVSALTPSREEILRTMGIVNSEPDEVTRTLIDDMMAELRGCIQARFAYHFTESVDFTYGKIIRDCLKDADRYVVVVATIGQEVDDLLHEYQKTDIVKAFVADAIASEMAEATIRKAAEYIEGILEEGEKMSNSYSPGYCGWLLKEQRKLFAYFQPEIPCGVVLNDSCLMLPIKSVSALMVIGPRVVKAPYGCEICTKSDCYKKRV